MQRLQLLLVLLQPILEKAFSLGCRLSCFYLVGGHRSCCYHSAHPRDTSKGSQCYGFEYPLAAGGASKLYLRFDGLDDIIARNELVFFVCHTVIRIAPVNSLRRLR